MSNRSYSAIDPIQSECAFAFCSVKCIGKYCARHKQSSSRPGFLNARLDCHEEGCKNKAEYCAQHAHKNLTITSPPDLSEGTATRAVDLDACECEVPVLAVDSLAVKGESPLNQLLFCETCGHEFVRVNEEVDQ